MRSETNDAAGSSVRARDDAIAALWQLLSTRHVEITKQQLHEACGEHVSIGAFANELRARGYPTRVVHARGRDLDHLKLPTLCMLRDGSAALLTGVAARHLTIRSADGQRSRVTREQWAERASGEALDVSGWLPERQTYLGRLLSVVADRPLPVVQIVVATLLMQLVAVAPSLLMQQAIDAALPTNASHTLDLLALAMLAVAGAQAWFGWFRERAGQYLHARAQSLLGDGLLERIVHLPLSYFQKHTVGDTAQAVAAGEQIVRLATESMPVPLLDGVFALSSLFTLCLLLPWAAALVAAGGLLLVLVGLLVGQREASLQDLELAAQAKQNGYLVELIAGAPALKAAGAERRAVEKWGTRLEIERRYGLQRQRANVLLEMSGECVAYSLVTLILIWGGNAAIARSLSVGTLVAALQLTQAFTHSAYRMAEVCARLAGARSQARILRRHLQVQPMPLARSARSAPATDSDAISFHDVWFRHGPELPWILRGRELRLQRGEELRLSGASGIGKTTMLRLMAGLYTPERGSVLIHGVDAVVARKSVAYVPQDTYLFQGSILDNLRVISGGAARAKLLDAAKLTGLDAFVKTLGMEYETLLPPGGHNLSGGQRQLIVLTACVASDRAILLLDEAMSQLDRLTQASLLKAALFASKTVVSVVHETASPEADVAAE